MTGRTGTRTCPALLRAARGCPKPLSSLSLSRSLSKQTSDKFEVAEGALPCHQAQKGRPHENLQISTIDGKKQAPHDALHNHGRLNHGRLSCGPYAAAALSTSRAVPCSTITCKPRRCLPAWTLPAA